VKYRRVRVSGVEPGWISAARRAWPCTGLKERLDGGNNEVLVDLVPGPNQRAAEDAVFAVVRAL